MHYGNIKLNDIANGEGIRVSLFVSGCTNHCKECFNPETWNFEYGKPFTEETVQFILDNLKSDFVNGLTLLGGEPFEPKNQPVLLDLVKRVRATYPNKSIWAYSGFRFDDELLSVGAYPHCEYTLELLKNIDILVDGRCVVCLSIIEDGVSEEKDKNDGLLDKIKDSEVSFQRLLGASFGFVFVGVVVYIVYNFVFKGSNERRKKK